MWELYPNYIDVIKLGELIDSRPWQVLSAKAFFEPRQRPPLLQRSLFPADAGVGGQTGQSMAKQLGKGWIGSHDEVITTC